MSRPKIIQPHVQTPPPGTAESNAVTRLPDPVMSEQVQRLAVCAALGAGLWSYGLVMDTLVRPLTSPAILIPGINIVVEVDRKSVV